VYKDCKQCCVCHRWFLSVHWVWTSSTLQPIQHFITGKHAASVMAWHFRAQLMDDRLNIVSALQLTRCRNSVCNWLLLTPVFVMPPLRHLCFRDSLFLCKMTQKAMNLGRNFPKTFFKHLPMSNDLEIPKKFSEFSTAFFALPKKFFSYLCKLVQPVRCTYADHVM